MLDDILDALFRQPPLFQFAIFLVNGLITFGLSIAFMRFFHSRPTPHEWAPVSPFFSSVSVVFSLFLAFHGAAIWANKTHAERSYLEAGTAIRRLDDMLGPRQLHLESAREALHRYVRHVLKDEWRKTTNHSASPEAESAFLDLHVRILAANANLAPPVSTQLNTLLNNAARAQSERLWVGANHTEAVSWLAVLFLGLLAHLSVAAVHIGRPHAGIMALTLFAVSTTIAYWSLGIVDDPYRFLQHLDPGKWVGPI